MTRDAFVAAVKAAGIVGEGGAGFPAHVKYASDADTVIANGCECEPLLHTDHHIMSCEGAAVLRGLRALADVAGASRAVLALKKKHTDLIPVLREAAVSLGLELFLLEDFYPAGDEQVLVREVTGRSVPPLGIPLNVGAVVANVGTLAKVDAALGGNGMALPVTRKVLTVTGEVARPGVMGAPIGAGLAECLALAGGALPREPVFVIGGPMMGRVVEGLEALDKESVTKTSGGLIALPAGHPLHRNATQDVAVMRRRAASACIQCRFCTDLCPRFLIGHPFETHRVMRAFAAKAEMEAEAGALAALCCECGVCEQYACPMALSPRRINQAVKAGMREHNKQYQGTRAIREASSAWREYRKIPLPRLAARLGIAGYMPLATPYLGEVTPARVAVALRQHLGAPAVPVVREGDRVRPGDLVGEIPDKALGARVHASIAGVVTRVDAAVHISREQGASNA